MWFILKTFQHVCTLGLLHRDSGVCHTHCSCACNFERRTFCCSACVEARTCVPWPCDVPAANPDCAFITQQTPACVRPRCQDIFFQGQCCAVHPDDESHYLFLCELGNISCICLRALCGGLWKLADDLTYALICKAYHNFLAVRQLLGTSLHTYRDHITTFGSPQASRKLGC